ncbi:MAG: hypothetical protein ACE5HO_06510 [bacterium]
MCNYPKNILTLLVFSGLMAGTLLAATTSAWAQEGAKKVQENKEVTKDIDLAKKKKDLNIFLDKIEILGRIEKPQTVFIIPGTDPSVDDIQIDRSFFKEIFRKIERDDFPRLADKTKNEPILW